MDTHPRPVSIYRPTWAISRRSKISQACWLCSATWSNFSFTIENDVNQRSLATQLWRDWVDTPEVSFQPSIRILLDITRYNLTGSTSTNPPWTHQLHHLPGNQPALVPINKQETVLSLERSLLSMRLSMNLCESARDWYHENGRYTNCIPWDPLIGSELQYWIIGLAWSEWLVH